MSPGKVNTVNSALPGLITQDLRRTAPDAVRPWVEGSTIFNNSDTGVILTMKAVVDVVQVDGDKILTVEIFFQRRDNPSGMSESGYAYAIIVAYERTKESERKDFAYAYRNSAYLIGTAFVDKYGKVSWYDNVSGAPVGDTKMKGYVESAYRYIPIPW